MVCSPSVTGEMQDLCNPIAVLKWLYRCKLGTVGHVRDRTLGSRSNGQRI